MLAKTMLLLHFSGFKKMGKNKTSTLKKMVSMKNVLLYDGT